VQHFETTFDVDAPPHRVWSLFHAPPPAGTSPPRVVEYPGGRMEILAEGNEFGEGLVRTCEFAVPRWLGSGGRAQSWEVVTKIDVNEFAGYQGVCKPLWAKMQGSHRLKERSDGGTRLTFVESYDVVSPILRQLFERRVHQFISRDNERLYRALLGYLGPVTRGPVDGGSEGGGDA
jgi:carbon monoxide dehydrogenase subunit G